MFQISEVLKKVPFFEDLAKDGIDFIIERLKFKPFESGEAVCESGDPGDKMYIVINGEVKVVVVAEGETEENIVAHLRGGQYFGEMSLLTGEPRSASVITTEPSEMFVLNKSDFDVIIERFPSITLSMGRIMSKRLRETLQKAAKGPAQADPALSGQLADRKLVDVLKFCEGNSLNGKVLVSRNEEKGEIHFEKGELRQITLGKFRDDEALDMMLKWEEGEFTIEPRKISMEAVQDDSNGTAAVKPRIVIVNKSVLIQKLLQRAFDSMGYEVYAVDSAAKAVQMVQSMDPALVITDIKLPDSSGIELVNYVREVSPVPFVMLTESDNRSQIEASAKAHTSIFFTNSQEIGEVVKVVETILK